MLNERTDFHKGAVIKQFCQTFTRRHFALFVLAVDACLAAAHVNAFQVVLKQFNFFWFTDILTPPNNIS